MKKSSRKLLPGLRRLPYLLLLLMTCLCAGPLAAQNNPAAKGPITITGKITDDKGAPFGGVSIHVKGAAGGTASRADGSYSIVVPNEKAVLVFTHVGFAVQELAPGSKHQLNVAMKEESTALGDVVVVAYGKQKKVTVTGAVSTVSGKELVSTSVSNVSNMLVGNAPGLSGLQASGEPGRNGATIYIRGVSTFAGSINPLVVIDGVEQAPERAYDQLNAMDANEIENISILKDASSTAVYGIRGANGVIIVTTKRGRAGKTSLSASANYGFTKATRLLHNTNSYEYAVMRNEAIRTEQSSFGNTSFNNNLFSDDDLWKFKNNRDYTAAEIAAMSQLSDAQKQQLSNSPALYYGSHDLFGEQFGGTGPQKQLNFNISGGTARLKYFTSLGYYGQGSILNNTRYYGANTESKYERYNFRSNFDIDVVKNLQISVNLAGQFGTTSGPGIGAGPYDLAGRYKIIMQYIFDSDPLTAPGLVDGKLVNSYAGVAGSASNPLGIKLGSLKGAQNPVRNLLVSGNEKLYNTLLSGSIVARYNMSYITRGLSLRATVNYDDNYVKAVTYTPSLPEYSVRRNPANPNLLDFFGGAIGASGFNPDPGHNSVWRKTYYDAGIDYTNTFGQHGVNALLLAKAQQYSIPNTSDNTASGSMGLVGRLAYNYAEKYLLEFNIGYNGTEQFIEGKRFGYFPAYSAGWVVSKEKFFPQTDWVSFLKIRGSYGEVGNDQIGSRRYLYLPSTFSTGQAGYYWGNSNGSVANPYYSGTIEGNIGNPDVAWERAIKRNFGVDARFLHDRLSVTVDVFHDKRDNILTNLSGIIPYAYGVASTAVPPANVGRVTNHGYELVAGWNDKFANGSYYFVANVNYARNKIEYMAEARKPYSWMAQTGYAIGQYKGLVSDGFFNTQEQLDNRPNNTYNGNKAVLGDVRYTDINGDGLIDVKDVVPIGYSNLPQYSFSFKAGGSFKGFDLSLLFTGTAKGSFNMANYQFLTPFFQTAGNALKWQYDGRWTADKVARGEKILYPRATINGGTGGNSNFMTSDLWLLSTDFARLKNLEIGYTLQKLGALRNINISSVRLYVNGNNLLTWGSAVGKGIDPESTDASGYAVYPMTRVFVIGANIRF